MTKETISLTIKTVSMTLETISLTKENISIPKEMFSMVKETPSLVMEMTGFQKEIGCVIQFLGSVASREDYPARADRFRDGTTGSHPAVELIPRYCDIQPQVLVVTTMEK